VRDRRFLTVSVRVDNVRVRVARLTFENDDAGGMGTNAAAAEDATGADIMDDERHFPSRIQIWVGPLRGTDERERNDDREEGTNSVEGIKPGAQASIHVAWRIKSKGKIVKMRKGKRNI
jgi:hypothetical protein